jgi:cytochrome c oxidase subunit 2
MLEIAWSVIPAGILIFLSLYQYESWADNKMRRPQISLNGKQLDQPPTAKIIAKQFGWEIYYPGADGIFGTVDDVYVENELYVPSDESVVLQLESRDVIHSFFIPVLRLKQDIVPGMKHFCWFRAKGADPSKNYEILCTELCGWGHYKMKGWVHIVPRQEFDQKMKSLNQVRAGMAPLKSNLKTATRSSQEN